MAFNDRTNIRTKGRYDATKHWQKPLMHSKQVREDVSPPGWKNTTEAMKDKDQIDNPWALAWYMKGQGDTPHK